MARPSTTARNGQALLPYLADIRKAAMGVWAASTVVKMSGLDPEDAAQEGVLHCLKYGQRYWRGDIPLVCYYRFMARQGVWQAVNTAVRRVKRDAPRQMTATRLGFGDPRGPTEMPEDRCPVDEEVLERLDVAQALGVLSGREREAVVLRYGLGGGPALDYRGVAAALGVTMGTAGRILYDAHRRLQSCLRVHDPCGG